MNAKRKLKILHTVESYALHAEDKSGFMRRMSEALVRRGHEVTVLTSKASGFQEPELGGVKIRYFDIGGSLSLGRRGMDLSRYQDAIYRSDAEVMLNYGAESCFTDLAFPVVDKTRLRRLNIFASNGFSALNNPAQVQFSAYVDYYQQVLPRALTFYDGSIYTSNEGEDFRLAKALNLSNIMVVPPGVNDEEFSSPVEIDIREKYSIEAPHVGLGIAKIHDYTGIDRILGCLRAAGREDLQVFIAVWGPEESENQPPNFRELTQKAAQLACPPKFIFNPSRQELLALYRAAAVFFYGTELEADGMPVYEARASKTPFITLDYPAVRGLKGGVICHQNDMWKVLLRILDDTGYRLMLAEAGWREWRAVSTWSAVVDKFEDFYIQLLLEMEFQAQIAAGQAEKREVVRRIAKRFGDLSAYLTGAAVELRAGKFVQAQSYLEDAAQLQPENGPLRKLLGQVRKRSVSSSAWIQRNRLQ